MSPDRAPADAPTIVVGVCGGIAAYKAVQVVRDLAEAGYQVQVVPTAAAEEFIGNATWEALSHHPVLTSVWQDVAQVPHVRLGQNADLVLVVPATANLMARAAAGLADDLLTCTLLTAGDKVVMAPAMHTEMWEHPATVANVATLRARGVHIIEPDSGRLTGTDTGKGRLPDPSSIVATVRAWFAQRERPQDLAGKRVVVSAGGTREAVDPVRFLGNKSSGKQGVAFAQAAHDRGAQVVLVAGAIDVDPGQGLQVVPVASAVEMHQAMLTHQKGADLVVMAAAVADYRPAAVVSTKIKKTAGESLTLELVENPDILIDLVQHRDNGQFIVGFAAETGDEQASALDHARAKLRRKGCDVLVFNNVHGGAVFGQDTNDVSILWPDGRTVDVPAGSKRQCADSVLDLILGELQ